MYRKSQYIAEVQYFKLHVWKTVIQVFVIIDSPAHTITSAPIKK